MPYALHSTTLKIQKMLASKKLIESHGYFQVEGNEEGGSGGGGCPDRLQIKF